MNLIFNKRNYMLDSTSDTVPEIHFKLQLIVFFPPSSFSSLLRYHCIEGKAEISCFSSLLLDTLQIGQQNLSVSVSCLLRQHFYTVSEIYCYHKTMTFLAEPSKCSINVCERKNRYTVREFLEFPSSLSPYSLSFPSAHSLLLIA